MANSSLLFDDLDATSSYAKSKDPIWTMDLDDPANEDKIKQWLVADVSRLKEKNEERFRQLQRNLQLYKGIQYLDQDRSDIRERGQDRSQVVRKIVANHLYDLVQVRVSRLIKFKPAVAVLPTNDEFSDKAAAKAVKQLLDHIWYINNFEGVVSLELAKLKSILGEAYCFISWDQHAGDLHPDYKSAQDQKIPLLNESGDQEKDDSGNPIFIDRPVRVGDVKYEVESPFNVFLEDKQDWAEVQYLYRAKIYTVAEARAKFPKGAEKIKTNDSGYYYNFETAEMEPLKDKVVVYEWYHKRSDILDQGRYICFTEAGILKNQAFPFDHDQLPCVRLIDVHVPHELHGKPGIENVKALTSTYNNLLNLVVRNQILCSHPKWMMPAGSAKKESLGNDITIVEYKGPQPPVLVQANPTSPETFEFMASLKEQFQQIYGLGSGVSRGEPPPGVTSGVALQFVAEQEQERFNEDILRFTEAIKQIAQQTISVAGTYYDATDDRMVRVLGKNNEWTSEFFDVANLSKDYDIRVQNTSALPQSRAARTQLLLDLNQMFPGQFPPEVFLDMFDLAESDKYISAATQNVRTAEAENEIILSGKGMDAPLDPRPEEDHIIHWKTHVREMQGYAFKFRTPSHIQELMRDMVMAHEMFMVQNAAKNPVYAEQLKQLAGFPLFFKIAPMVQTPPQTPLSPQQAQPMAGKPYQQPGQPVQMPGEPVQQDMKIQPQPLP